MPARPAASARSLVGADGGDGAIRGPRRRNPRVTSRGGWVVALALVTACTGGGSDTTSGTQRFVAGEGIAHVVDPDARKPGPTLSGTTLDGERLEVSGGPAVINIWGSWCAPCKKEQPALERVARATRSRGVRFVGINIRDGSRTPALRHVERYDVSYPSLYDPSARLLPRFEIAPKTIPSTYVLDREGRIAAYVYGEVDEETLTSLVDRVLGGGA